MTRTVLFPGLGLEFHLNRVAFTLFGLPIYWYGVIIALGFLLAVVFCYKMAPRFGIKPDDVIDLLFFAVPLAIIGARLYYIIFYLDLYRNEDGSYDFLEMVDIRDGGLAIYGGVIAAVLTLIVFCRVKKINFFAFADVGVFGLLIGQCVGQLHECGGLRRPYGSAVAHGHRRLCERRLAVLGGASHLPL